MASAGARSEGAGVGGDADRQGDRGGGDRDSECAGRPNWGGEVDDGVTGSVVVDVEPASVDDEEDDDDAPMSSGDVAVDDDARKRTLAPLPPANSAAAADNAIGVAADGGGGGIIAWSSWLASSETPRRKLFCSGW
jgi:hypothetical protein